MNLPFFSQPNKPPERFYLFAGMGGAAGRRKHRRILGWSIAAGILVSGVLATVMFLVNRAAR